MAAAASPRQKLINMMYLVLTALLALQVSGLILERFVLENAAATEDVIFRLYENDNIFERIKNAVHRSGDREGDLLLLEKVKKIKEKTEKVISEIEKLKIQLLDSSGNKIKKTSKSRNKILNPKKVKNLKNDSVVSRLMINLGNGKKLKKSLNDYSQFLTDITGMKYKNIALDANEMEITKNDPNQSRKDFVNLYFYKTPLAAALLTLTRLESKVAKNEAHALTVFYRELGSQDFKVDVVTPRLVAEQKTVVDGTNFKAEIFASAYSKSTDMKVIVNGVEQKVSDGICKLDFPVKSKTKDHGLEKKDLKYDILLKNQKGEVSKYSGVYSYFVTKPYIRVESGATVARVYRGCKNPLDIRVPELGSEYNPRFVAKGAKIENLGRGKINVLPLDKSKITFGVYQKNVFLGNVECRVEEIPLPQIKVSIPGKTGAVNLNKGLNSARLPRSLRVSAIPDKSFKELLPKEALYKISKGTVTLATYLGVSKSRIKITSSNIDITSLARLAIPGDIICVEVTEVRRKTALDPVKGEIVKLGSMTYNIPVR